MRRYMVWDRRDKSRRRRHHPGVLLAGTVLAGFLDVRLQLARAGLLDLYQLVLRAGSSVVYTSVWLVNSSERTVDWAFKEGERNNGDREARRRVQWNTWKRGRIVGGVKGGAWGGEVLTVE